jgi:hypothetical protein
MTRWHLTILFLAVLLTSRTHAQQDSSPGGMLDGLYHLQDTTTARISSWDRTGGNMDFVQIAPGETKTLAEISGAGVIRRFYFAPLSSDRMRYRKMILRIYWDGQRDPCVEVPLGDFFGSGLGTLRYFHSVAMDVNPGIRSSDFDAMVSYLPMPFAKGARITLENDGDMNDLIVWYHFDYEKYPDGKLPPHTGRFHAQWRRVPNTPVATGIPKNTQLGANTSRNITGDSNYFILDATGHGNFVGLYLTVDNIAGGWYGEGDDMIFVDGQKWPPTYPGSGHEEVFNAGCCPDEEFWGLYTGFYLIENHNAPFGGKNQMYRFYVNDPVRFQKSIRVTIEHGHDNNFENDYTSTAFWYQDEPHETFPPMPKAHDRLPAWPNGVTAALEAETRFRQAVSEEPRPGKIKLSEADTAEWQKLEALRNKAFRAFHYDDFIRDVNAMGTLLSKYPQYKPAQP